MARRRKKSWGPSNALWRYLHRKGKATHRTRRVHTMARRRRFGRRGRSRGGLGLGRVLSMKNILFTVAGASLAPRFVGVNPQIGGAVGGFMGAGIPGAVLGYLAGVPVANATSGILGGSSGNNW